MHGVAGWTFVSPEYFRTFKIPVVRGRSFTSADRVGAPGAVIVNQTFANRAFPHGDALGQRLQIGAAIRPEYAQDGVREIVGIVGDVRDQALNSPARLAMYVPIAQLPDVVNAINLRLLPVAWFVRTAAATPELSARIQQELQRASGGLPVGEFRSMEEVTARSTAAREFSMWLMTIFGTMALALALIGMYGLMAQAVQQRTQEIGIRMALGAGLRGVRRMVVWQGMRLALIGVGAGMAGALVLTRFLAAFLFAVAPRDPAVFVAVPVLLCVVSLAAVWIPARAATRINPVEAIRFE
jgi:predicted permease